MNIIFFFFLFRPFFLYLRGIMNEGQALALFSVGFGHFDALFQISFDRFLAFLLIFRQSTIYAKVEHGAKDPAGCAKVKGRLPVTEYVHKDRN